MRTVLSVVLRKLLSSLGVCLMMYGLSVTAAGAAQPPANAARPTQSSLKSLITGNSIQGVWAGRPFSQYFSPLGTTDYQETGRQMTSGRWRVNAGGQYCSVWPPSPSEVCYDVRVLGKSIYWRSGDSYYESHVIDGNVFAQ